MAIQCCRNCVAPKRYPGCHGKCQDYIDEKAQYDQLKGEYKKKSDISNAIIRDRGVKVYKAYKNHKKMW